MAKAAKNEKQETPEQAVKQAIIAPTVSVPAMDRKKEVTWPDPKKVLGKKRMWMHG